MNFRKRMTSDEWLTLQYSPLWAFEGVAGADRTIDQQELAVMAAEVEQGELYDDALVRELLAAIDEDPQLLKGYRKDRRDMSSGLAEAADVLERQVPQEHGLALKQAVLLMARKVAEASGDEEFSSQRLGDEERQTLFRIADILGTTLDGEQPGAE